MLRNMDDISETCGSFFLALLLVFTFGGADDHQLTWEICWTPDGDGHVDASDTYTHTIHSQVLDSPSYPPCVSRLTEKCKYMPCQNFG